MPYAYVGSAANASNGNTVTYSPTAGNFLLIISSTSSGGGSPTFTVADNSGSTYTVDVAATADANNQWNGFAHCASVLSGVTTVTITYNGGTPGSAYIGVVEYSGISTSSPYQGISAINHQASPGTGANAVTSNAFSNTSQPAAIIGISIDIFGNGPAWTAGTGYTLRAQLNSAIAVEDLRATSNASQTATFTTTHGTTTFDTYVLAFTEAASGGTLLGQIWT